MNSVNLIGRLTADPELSYVKNVARTTFILAVEKHLSNGKKFTSFIPCVVWRSYAEQAANILEKGQKAGVSGWWKTNTYQEEGGRSNTSHELVVEYMDFLEKPKAK